MNSKFERPVINKPIVSQFIYLFIMDLVKVGLQTFDQYQQHEPGYAEPLLKAFIYAFQSKPDGRISHELLKKIQKIATAHLAKAGKGEYKVDSNNFHLNPEVYSSDCDGPLFSVSELGLEELIKTWILDKRTSTHSVSFTDIEIDGVKGWAVYAQPNGKALWKVFTGNDIASEQYIHETHFPIIKELYKRDNIDTIIDPLVLETDGTQAKTIQFMQWIIDEYEAEITTCENDDDTIKAICKYLQRIEQLHPFMDGNIRTLYVLLNKLLRDHGLDFSLMLNPNRLDACDLDDLVRMVKEGQTIFNALTQHTDPTEFVITTSERLDCLKTIKCPPVTLANAELVAQFMDEIVCQQKPAQPSHTFKTNRQGIFSMQTGSVMANLIAEIKSSPEKNNNDVLSSLHKGQIGLAFRQSCKLHLISSIAIFLKYKDQLNIDINEPSSNQNTALDWYDQSKSLTQKEIVTRQLLIDHGAQNKQTLSKMKV